MFQECLTPKRHRRSRSDDMFRRKFVSTTESLKRAEEDGYKNFLTSNIPELEIEDNLQKQKKIRRIVSACSILNGSDPSQIQVRLK